MTKTTRYLISDPNNAMDMLRESVRRGFEEYTRKQERGENPKYIEFKVLKEDRDRAMEDLAVESKEVTKREEEEEARREKEEIEEQARLDKKAEEEEEKRRKKEDDDWSFGNGGDKYPAMDENGDYPELPPGIREVANTGEREFTILVAGDLGGFLKKKEHLELFSKLSLNNSVILQGM